MTLLLTFRVLDFHNVKIFWINNDFRTLPLLIKEKISYFTKIISNFTSNISFSTKICPKTSRHSFIARGSGALRWLANALQLLSIKLNFLILTLEEFTRIDQFG